MLKDFKQHFVKMTNAQLIKVSQEQKNNNGWTNSRAEFMVALNKELRERNLC